MGNKKKERKKVNNTLRGQSASIIYMDEWAFDCIQYECPICSEVDAFNYIINATKPWLCRICGSRNEPDLSDLPFGCLATGSREDA